MRWISIVLLLLLAALQYPLWIGKGGWLRVKEIDTQLQAQREINQKHEMRNASMEAEVRDLKSGHEAIEERARYELGMIRKGEIFMHIPEKMPPKESTQSSQ